MQRSMLEQFAAARGDDHGDQAGTGGDQAAKPSASSEMVGVP